MTYIFIRQTLFHIKQLSQSKRCLSYTGFTVFIMTINVQGWDRRDSTCDFLVLWGYIAT